MERGEAVQKVRKRREYSAFGKLVKKGLIDKNMTAIELSSLLGIKYQYLNSILHGERSPGKYRDKIVEILELVA